jgi:hypothetical protein
MACNEILKWLKMFVIFTLIIFFVWIGFEYLVFGLILTSNLFMLGFSVPSAIVYALLLGIAFATAQYVLSPKSPAGSSYMYSAPPEPVSRKRAKPKAKARKKRR